MCIDIMDIMFGIANRQISTILIELFAHNGGILPFHVYIL